MAEYVIFFLEQNYYLHMYLSHSQPILPKSEQASAMEKSTYLNPTS